MSTYTPNKNIEQPAHGAYNDDWDVPVNANSAAIDTAFGGSTPINVTGITGPYIVLSISQYTPPNIEFSGTLSANLYYIIPTGVGGQWSAYNATSGAFSLYLNTGGGTSVALTQGYRTLCLSDGVNMEVSDNGTAFLAGQAAEVFAQNAANTAQSNAETYAATQASTAQSNAEAFAADGSNISSGVVNKNNLPLAGTLNGITIAADPGTTPSGSFGDIFYYY